ncbi:ParM/StbA family protein [Roseibium sp. RKSG952]|uniref:ParM/StbA family protein n=1 Tax=Roseibium sp. RKSG952 TaxID=2529384 RepID=UPI0012BC3E51|nr:ParM/StbA family protein [Roseibium sp. RKSG952]MTH95714.1 ParM/StbA family protein [Roseibium sp. RKSG952]
MSDIKTPDAPLLKVAIDDGYAQTKLYGIDEDGNVVTHVMRSSVRPGRYGLGAISGTGNVGLYETDDGSFTVSDEIESENTQFDGFHLSAMNRVLVNHALVVAGFGGKEVDIITGLPVADFFIRGLKDEEKIEKKKANLKKPVKLDSDDGLVADIKNVDIGCQAVAAWVDFALNDDLELRDGVDGAVAIVDIGGRTTDIATVVNGQSIDHARSGTANIGVLDVYKGVESAIGIKYKMRDEFPIATIDKAVRTGKIHIWGKEEDVADLVSDVIKEYESKISREVERQIASGATMNAVVFVGGGSALFHDIAGTFPNGHLPEDPEFANARGLFKYAAYKAANA